MPRPGSCDVAQPPMQGAYVGGGPYITHSAAPSSASETRSSSHRMAAGGGRAGEENSAAEGRWGKGQILSPQYSLSGGWGGRAAAGGASGTSLDPYLARANAARGVATDGRGQPLSPDDEVAELVDKIVSSGQVPEDPELSRVARIQPDRDAACLSSFSDQLLESVGHGNLTRPVPISGKKGRAPATQSPGGGVDLPPTELSFGCPSSRSADRRRESQQAQEEVSEYRARYPDQSRPPPESEIASLRRKVEEEEKSRLGTRAAPQAPQQGVPHHPAGSPLYPTTHFAGQSGGGAASASTAPRSRPRGEALPGTEELRGRSAPREASASASPEFDELCRWRVALERQHVALKEREAEVERKALALQQQGAEKEWRALQIEARERELNLREMKLQHSLDGLKAAEAGFDDRQRGLDAKMRDTLELQRLLEAKMAEVNQKVLELHNREGVMEVREQVLSCREREALSKRDELENLERMLERRLRELQDTEISLTDWKEELSAQHARNVQKQHEVRDDEAKLNTLAAEMRREQQFLESKISTLRHMERFSKPVPQQQQPSRQPPAAPTGDEPSNVFDLDHLASSYARAGEAGTRSAAVEEEAPDTTRVLDMDGTLDSAMTSEAEPEGGFAPVGGAGGAPRAGQTGQTLQGAAASLSGQGSRKYTGYVSPDPEAALRGAVHPAAQQQGASRSGYISPDPEVLRKVAQDVAAAQPAAAAAAAAAATASASPPPPYSQQSAFNAGRATKAAAADAFREQIIRELEREDFDSAFDDDFDDNGSTESPPSEASRASSEEPPASTEMDEVQKPQSFGYAAGGVYRNNTVPPPRRNKYYEGRVDLDPHVPSYVTEIESTVEGSRDNSLDQSNLAPSDPEGGVSLASARKAPDVFTLPPAKPVQGLDAGGAAGGSSPAQANNVSSGSVYDID